MKKVYLVHCWGGNINDGWYPWIKKELEKLNVEVIMEDMPNTETPKIDEWVDKLNSIVNSLDEDTYFIGHSIGCQTIMRYLETKDITNIGGILFVAPWLDLLPDEMDEESNEVAYEWINKPIDFSKVKQFSNNIHAIFSTNDYYVSLDQEKEFQDKLNAITIRVVDKGHISEEDGIKELPEILDECRNMLKK